MSMVATRSPITAIGMNGAGPGTRRSARLSSDGQEDNERSSKRQKTGEAQAVSVKETGSSKRTRGKGKAAPFRDGGASCSDMDMMLILNTVYDNKDGDFEFTKRAKPSKKTTTKASKTEQTADLSEPATGAASRTAKAKEQKPSPAAKEDDVPKTTRKPRGKLPSSPQENAVPKTGRTKRTFQEIKSPSPRRPARAQTNANHDRSPSPGFRPVTVKKKRPNQNQTPAPETAPAHAPEDDKTTKIALPFADTPIIKRNKEMRKASADSNRRSSSGMRGRRASSLIDEGRGSGEFAHLRCIISNPRAYLSAISNRTLC